MFVTRRKNPRPDGDSGELPDVPSGARSRAARRQRAVLLVAVASALVSTGGWAASALVKSPAERAARTAPPPRSLITAAVTSRVLNPSVTARAAVYPATQYNVVPTAAATDVTQLYLSRLNVRTGDPVGNGQLLAEVSGQPLYVLKGLVPAYRDLKPGSNGSDVAELQQALTELGHSSGSDDEGSFGPGTKRAVTDFYRALGYQVPLTGTATQQAVDAAQKAVDTSQQSVAALTVQQRTGEPPTVDINQQLAAAKRQLSAERTALAKAIAVNGPMVPAAHLVFLPTLPASVTAVNSSVGMPVSGTLISLTSGGLTITGQLTPAQAEAVKPGMAVEILAEDSGTRLTGTVAELGAPTTTPPAGKVISIGGVAAPGAAAPAAPNTGGNAGANTGAGLGATSYVPVTIAPAADPAATLNGRNVRITILRDSSSQPVPAVPVAAISTDASGQTSVTTVAPDGTRTTVPVTTGVTVDGLVGITPADGGALKVGDQVVVGT